MNNEVDLKKMPWLSGEYQDNNILFYLRDKLGSEVLLPGIAAVLVVLGRDEDKNLTILLGRRGDNGKWSIPSGGKNPEESVLDAAIRELKEETGLVADKRAAYLLAEYSDRDQIHVYPNGAVAYTKIVYYIDLWHCIGRPSCADGENTELDFFVLKDLPENCSGSTIRIAHDILNLPMNILDNIVGY